MTRRADGSVYQRHDHPSCREGDHRCYGRWVSAVTVDGKRVVHYHRTKREALDDLRKMLNERDRGGLRAQSTTLGAWMDHWYDTSATTRVRTSTLRGYRSKLDQYVLPALGKRKVASVRPSDLEALYAGMASRGLAPRTIQQTHAVLHQALGKAVKEGLLTSNPADLADTPPVRKEPPVVLDPATTRKVLVTAKDRWWRHRPDEARWFVALTLGLRQGEALGLSWRDVDLERGTVSVRQALQRQKGRGLVLVPPKSQAGYRTIPMTTDCWSALDSQRVMQEILEDEAGEHWRNEWDLVFTQPNGSPVDPSDDWASWHDLLDEAGVPQVKPHAARHTAITMWLLAGVPMHTAKVWAGHSSINVTSDTYGGMVAEMHEQGLAALGDIYATSAELPHSHLSELESTARSTDSGAHSA